MKLRYKSQSITRKVDSRQQSAVFGANEFDFYLNFIQAIFFVFCADLRRNFGQWRFARAKPLYCPILLVFAFTLFFHDQIFIFMLFKFAILASVNPIKILQ